MHQKKIATFMVIEIVIIVMPFILALLPIPNYPAILKEYPFIASLVCMAIFSFLNWKMYQDQKEEMDRLERGV